MVTTEGAPSCNFTYPKTTKENGSKIEVGINVEFTPPDFGDLPEFEVEFIGDRRQFW